MIFCGKCYNCKSVDNFRLQGGNEERKYCKKCNSCLDDEARIRSIGKIKNIVYKGWSDGVFIDNTQNRRIEKYHKNKEYWKAKAAIIRSKDGYKEKSKINNDKYYAKNKKKLLKQNVEYNKKRYKKDALFKLKYVLRGRMMDILKKRNKIKNQKTIDILGVKDISIVKKHIENKFKPGMSWDNHGFDTWHIDHITPLCSAKTEEDLYKLFHYTNLQPLWAKENLSKNGKF
jgi:hypothetical protein